MLKVSFAETDDEEAAVIFCCALLDCPEADLLISTALALSAVVAILSRLLLLAVVVRGLVAVVGTTALRPSRNGRSL